ncbi:hypothetical protein PTSG_06854 [Salpingoeca rosetta]|uniref:Uncharacterized protein n=1 Tax=Salpingoeca rosetta (strain ATCC 50818 / BSB-021) TaxID=946362 RepID=F2UF01_SALR5|nr:uncharacterized protein PTSG_06854 [Salpingoeca rosetta]EGD75201.1 hypothetical protein PTSG_06854 [Salpingoeca rosetta]|eukprot:XP_004992254.1 hypothetical protein PTSG_06854 [Salpingoeca rosetta]
MTPSMARLAACAALLSVLCCSSSFVAAEEQCNVDRPECGFLNNRQCPDPASGHPSHLNRCCQKDSLGCYTACCADYFGSSIATVVVMAVFLTFCLLCPILAYCCKKLNSWHANREQERVVEEQVQRTERSFDEREHARRAGMRTETPPSYYGPGEKAPDYEAALSDTVLVSSGGSTANLLASTASSGSGNSETAAASGANSSNGSGGGGGGVFSLFGRRRTTHQQQGSTGRTRQSALPSLPEEEREHFNADTYHLQATATATTSSSSSAGEAPQQHEYTTLHAGQQASTSNSNSGDGGGAGNGNTTAPHPAVSALVAEAEFRAPTPSSPPAYDSVVHMIESINDDDDDEDDGDGSSSSSSSSSLRRSRTATPVNQLEEQDV